MSFLTIILLLVISAALGYTQPKATSVDFEMMTWPEVKAAMEHGKTTALVYNGGTEQRGPQNVNGGHTLMGRDGCGHRRKARKCDRRAGHAFFRE